MELKDKLLKLRGEITNSKVKIGKRIPNQKTEITEEQRKMLEDFRMFREGEVTPVAKALSNHFKNKYLESIDLDDKVDMFIQWYFENMIKGNYTDVGEFYLPREMRNFIEKMAVWFELRYPDYEVNKLMHCSGQEQKNINDEMFKKNPYTNEMINGIGTIWSQWSYNILSGMDWEDFYNTECFINSLPYDERGFLSTPKYANLIYLHSDYALYNHGNTVICKTAHIHLSSDGYVNECEDVGGYTSFEIRDEELIGLHVKDVIEMFKSRNIELPENNELEKAIDIYNKLQYQKEEMLNCVMYRIIERGGNRFGPRRAFLFAKEFERNIDIPMMYAIDYSDPGLRTFMNEYIKAGGSKDLECYVGYFSRTNNKEKLNKVSIQELILTLNNNAATFYTPEEDELHQRLVNALANCVNKDLYKEETRREEVKKLRLERKLEKSKVKK